MTILSAALLLFLVMDPIGNIPIFTTTLKRWMQSGKDLSSRATC